MSQPGIEPRSLEPFGEHSNHYANCPVVYKKFIFQIIKSVLLVNFQSHLLEFDFEGYIPLIMNMKKANTFTFFAWLQIWA